MGSRPLQISALWTASDGEPYQDGWCIRFITNYGLELVSYRLHNSAMHHMYTLISYPVGVVIEGVILNQTEERMRILAPGFSDVLELTRLGSGWITDQGDEVEFEFLEPISATPQSVAPSAARALALGAIVS